MSEDNATSSLGSERPIDDSEARRAKEEPRGIRRLVSAMSIDKASGERLAKILLIPTLLILPFIALRYLSTSEGDIRYYHQVAQSVVGIPGWTEAWAYPPLAGIIIYPLKWITVDGAHQYFLYIVSGISLAVTLVSLRLYRAPYFFLGSLYLAGMFLSLGILFVYRFDSVTLATTILAILALSRGRDVQAGLWLAIGGLVKSWPLVLAGAIGTVMGRYRVIAVVAAVLAITTTLGLLANAVPWSWLTFASEREIQFESIAALPAVWGGYLGFSDHGVGVTWYGAYAFAPYLGWVLVAMVAICGLGLAILTWRSRKEIFRPSPKSFWNETGAAYLVVVIGALLLVSPVLSTQFMIWIGALLLASVAYGWLGREAIISIPMFALSGLIYPTLFWDIVGNDELFPLLVLSGRDVLLVAIVFSAGLRVWQANRLTLLPDMEDVKNREIPA